MTTLVFVRCFLADYARNRVNLLMLVLVPVVFVVVAAGSMADWARLLGGPGGPTVETATAGWAAGFLAGLAMYFQVSGARDPDRRLVLAGLPPARLVIARLSTGLILAVTAAATALLALVVRSGIDTPLRVIAGTAMFAMIYMAIGALVGALVPNPVNGSVLILFVWIIDVFFGPAFGSADQVATRGLPTHFVTRWMLDLPSLHAGWLGNLGWALAWTAAAAVIAWTVVFTTARPAHPAGRGRRPGSVTDQLAGGIRMGLRDYRRNPVLWVLLLGVPTVFVVLAWLVTPQEWTTMSVIEDGTRISESFWLPNIHAGTMTPIAIASLAAIAGLFIVLDARAADQRLALAGFRTGALLGARMTVIGIAVILVTAASLAVTAATGFRPAQWGVYAAASLIIGLTYGLIGVLIGPIFGRVAGVFIAFLVPFLDLAMAQSPMLRAEPAPWARALPGYGSTRVLIDGALTAHFDETTALLLALAWLIGLTIAAALLFRTAAGHHGFRRPLDDRRPAAIGEGPEDPITGTVDRRSTSTLGSGPHRHRIQTPTGA